MHPCYPCAFHISSSPSLTLVKWWLELGGADDWATELPDSDSIVIGISPTQRTHEPDVFFPTCQVRVVRFYQSCCPPLPRHPPPPRLSSSSHPPPVSPRPCLYQLPPQLPPCQLFAKLFANFPAQCAPLDLNLGASQLSAHRWTSTLELPSSVCTAGPQPGTFPAQCAPLDLNLGSSQLSVHRWTSTWDLPSSVCTAGPQPGTFPAQCAPLDLNLGTSQLSMHRWTSTAK